MLMPDVNVLVYAHRRDQPQHHSARRWIEAHLGRSEPLALSTLVAVAFVRIVTSRRIFNVPTSTSLAISAIDAIVERETCRLLSPGPNHWQLVSHLCRTFRATGKQVADAQHAALAIEHGCEWVTYDDDFAKFEGEGLRWRRL